MHLKSPRLCVSLNEQELIDEGMIFFFFISLRLQGINHTFLDNAMKFI